MLPFSGKPKNREILSPERRTMFEGLKNEREMGKSKSIKQTIRLVLKAFFKKITSLMYISQVIFQRLINKKYILHKEAILYFSILGFQ